MLKPQQQGLKSPAADIKSNDIIEKINLLAENVQSLVERNQTIDDEIKMVQSNFASVTYQIRQINVSISCIHLISIKKFSQENLNGTFTYASSCDEYFQQGNRSNGTFLIRPNPALGLKQFFIS